MGCRGSKVRILSPRPSLKRNSLPPNRVSSENKTQDPTPSNTWQDEPFRRLVDSVSDYGIFLLDTEGRIASWNRGAQRIKGYLPAEIIGKHFSIFYPKSAVERCWPEH